MNTEKVKPARPGLLVRHPEQGRHLMAEGEEVPLTTYWRRRIAAGEVVKVSAAPAAQAKTTKREE